MKSISELIARRANAEVNGRFWQGRFKCQLLRDERALLAAVTYVDFTGRMISPGKRGTIKETEARALTKLGLDPRHWTTKVKHRQRL